MSLVIPLWVGIAVWATQLAILGVLIFFAVRVRPHDLHQIDSDLLKTLREIRDEFKRFEARMEFLIVEGIAKHEEDWHNHKRNGIPGLPGDTP